MGFKLTTKLSLSEAKPNCGRSLMYGWKLKGAALSQENEIEKVPSEKLHMITDVSNSEGSNSDNSNQEVYYVLENECSNENDAE